MLLLTIVPLVIAGLLALTESTERLRLEQERRTRQTAELIAGRARQLMLNGEQLATLVASMPATARLLAADTSADPTLDGHLGSVVRSHPEVDRLLVLDPQGQTRAAYPPHTLPAPTLEAARRGVVSRRWLPRHTPEGGVDLLLPVRDAASPQPLGWVVVGLPNETIVAAIGLPADTSEEVRAVLHDEAHKPVASVARWPERAAGLPIVARQRAPEDTVIAEAAVHAGWSVRVIESLEAYRALVRRELLHYGLVVLVVSGLAAAVAWRFAQGLVHDVRRVARSARAILRGHYLNAHVELERDDELGLLARSFNHMSRELEKRERERDVFGRLVSPEVRDQLLQGELMLGGHEVEVTVLLSDIRGFTQLCETMKPRDIVLTLNEYFTRMTQAVQRYGGYVNNFMGDAMVVVFGAPTPDEHQVERGLYAAAAMRQALKEFNQERLAYGAPPLRIGIGLASGPALAGQIGSPDRCIYTVIGDTVNVAARLESLSKQHREAAVLVNRETRDRLPPHLQALLQPLGAHQVKGRGGSVEVFALPRDAELPPPPAHLLRPLEDHEEP
ncbi:adenylate/guanylate cyclase domain-containing protein [Caldimonas thermodepolymerans]|uniref:Class 3 adenylate cyclase n=1 Tax=Caldimonas thermodepolymerans TaxID=215580 RepID=A0AA46DGX1_9BURK|nr:adenylate/guanylate cyclase domain-containing protein [Caldimonas thermodepolymerans]RDI02727.1 class 3 adenylate cyclase [Caldimonas thermodepolymerans]TCP08743.1 class 3 adenylate cyclase [Caldimonas thermodepolymerans]